MAVKVIGIEHFSRDMRKFIKTRQEEYRKSVIKSVIDYLPDLVKDTPVDTGEMASSWDYEEHSKGVDLGNYAPHSPIVEYGSRPFKPPIRPLLAWAKRVLKDASQPPKYSSDVWKLAKGTQKKIMKEGMAPKHIMEKTLPKILESIQEDMERKF